MQQKPAQELGDVERHQALLVFVSGVAPAEGHLIIFESNEPVIRDSDAVCVTAKIAEGMLSTAKRPLAVDYPLLAESLLYQLREHLAPSQWLQRAMEPELTLRKDFLHGLSELASEHFGKDIYGKKELWMRWNPVSMIERKAARRHHTVDVGMMLELLIPRMQHAEETDLGSQSLRIACNLQQRFRTQAKEQIVHHALVLQSQRRQFMRERKNNMHIACRQKLTLACRQPAVASVRLALGAVPVSARVERDNTMPAAHTFIQMTAERCGAAALDGGQHF